MAEWHFDDPPNVACFSQRQIISGLKPILFVTHDDDGYWQFLDGGDAKNEEAVIVGLTEIVALDSSVTQLADLPYGWCAWRNTIDDEWQRASNSKDK